MVGNKISCVHTLNLFLQTFIVKLYLCILYISLIYNRKYYPMDEVMGVLRISSYKLLGCKVSYIITHM